MPIANGKRSFTKNAGHFVQPFSNTPFSNNSSTIKPPEKKGTPMTDNPSPGRTSEPHLQGLAVPEDQNGVGTFPARTRPIPLRFCRSDQPFDARSGQQNNNTILPQRLRTVNINSLSSSEIPGRCR